MVMNMPGTRVLHGINEMKVTLHKRWPIESPHIRHVFEKERASNPSLMPLQSPAESRVASSSQGSF